LLSLVQAELFFPTRCSICLRNLINSISTFFDFVLHLQQLLQRFSTDQNRRPRASLMYVYCIATRALQERSPRDPTSRQYCTWMRRVLRQRF